MSRLPARLVVRPVTPERWEDFEKLFGGRGACGGCWCMLWRRSRSEFEANKGAGNRRAMKRLVDAGRMPGLLAYRGEVPVGWCGLAPREQYPALKRSRLLKPIDARPVWSVSCLFVEKRYRRQGVSAALLRAAVSFVRKQGGKIVEGYPQAPGKKTIPDVFAWTGLAGAFLQAGFKVCARPSRTRLIMRHQRV